tara:strand:+ start:1603 stop:1932 length:330 start_codon:yes stop_codon:yes gene_type:complete
MERKKTIVIGNINSADESPNQVALKAFPLFKLKYLDILVVAVWDIKPCPDNLKRKIPINNKKIVFIKEKKIDEKNKRKITPNEKFINLKSSIFLPIQINEKLLANVATA